MGGGRIRKEGGEGKGAVSRSAASSILPAATVLCHRIRRTSGNIGGRWLEGGEGGVGWGVGREEGEEGCDVWSRGVELGGRQRGKIREGRD